MFRIDILTLEGFQKTFENNYDDCDFSWLIREITKYTETNRDFSVDFDFQIEKSEDGFSCVGFTDKQEVKDTVFAILDEIQCQRDAINFIIKEHYWNNTLVKKLKGRRESLLILEDKTLYFIENYLNWLK